MTLLCASNIQVALSGKILLADISLTLEAGTFTGIVGPNEAGKSTLLKALIGLVPLANCAVTLQGKPFNAAHAAKRIAYIPDEATCHWSLTTRQVVMLGRLPHLPSLRLPNSADAEIANETMQACDVLAHADLPFHRLSHGVRARVMLARALVQQPKLLLADEPLGGLDIAHQLQLMELFRRKAKDGMGVLAVMHDLALAARYCDSVIVLSQGRIAASGQPESVLTQQNLQTFFHVEAALRSVENIPTLVAHRALSDS